MRIAEAVDQERVMLPHILADFPYIRRGGEVFRDLTDYSYPKIAEEFGGRDHTTVMHACEKIRGQMAEKRVVLDQVNDLISRIKQAASGVGG